MPDEPKKHCKNSGGRYIPSGLRTRLLIESGFKCPMPRDVCNGPGKTLLEFHHIDAYSKTQTHKFSRMIAVCPNCHSSLDSGGLRETVERVKNDLCLSSNTLVSLYSQEHPTLLKRLDVEGKYLELNGILSMVINYCNNEDVFLPFLPELAVEKAKSLRKMQSTNKAIYFLNGFEQRWSKILTEPQEFSIKLARGYALYNELHFDSAYKLIGEALLMIGAIEPLRDRRNEASW